MSRLNGLRRRVAFTVAAVGVPMAALAPPAASNSGPSASDDWGRVAPGGLCAQSTAWLKASQNALGMIVYKILETHSPALPGAPEERLDHREKVSLHMPPEDGIWVGNYSKVFSRSYTGKYDKDPGTKRWVSEPCAAYAESGSQWSDFGFPYFPPVFPGLPSNSPVGFRMENIRSSAIGRPGKPAQFKTTADTLWISVLGIKYDAPKTRGNVMEPNHGFRIPLDRTKPPLGSIMANEQVSTDAKGNPTVDSTGAYQFDATASSGYVNGGHFTLLGATAVDWAVFHAGVLTSNDGVMPCSVTSRCTKARQA